MANLLNKSHEKVADLHSLHPLPHLILNYPTVYVWLSLPCR